MDRQGFLLLSSNNLHRKKLTFVIRPHIDHMRHLGQRSLFALTNALLISGAALLQGCASLQGAPEWPTAQSLEKDDPLYYTFMTRFYAADTSESRALIRNQFIEVRSALINLNFNQFKKDMFAQRGGAAVGVDFVTMLLGGVAASVADKGVKTGAGALTTVVVGSKASLDKNVFYDRTLPVLLTQMEAKRAQVRERILAGMSADPALYPLMQASSDLEAYFDAGTISGALTEVTAQAGVVKEQADQALRKRLPSVEELQTRFKSQAFRIVVVDQADTDVTAMSQCLGDTGELAPAVKAAFKLFLQKRGMDVSDETKWKSNFVLMPEGKENRKAALADPVLGPVIKACAKK